ncbi:DUF2969 family protein [Streptococcus pyogenes]
MLKRPIHLSHDFLAEVVDKSSVVGEIAELDEKFAVLKNDGVDCFFKTLEQAVENIIENYNLNH